jgi:hypothetical protein
MYKLAVAVLASVAAMGVLAQEAASKMTRDELLAFLPGTKVTHTTDAGSVRHWTNEPAGKFVASSTNKKIGNALGTQAASGAGTWTVNDAGKYCIDIDWRRLQENWCAYVLKSPDGAYYLNVAEPQHKIEFEK